MFTWFGGLPIGMLPIIGVIGDGLLKLAERPVGLWLGNGTRCWGTTL
jgi:hypothetical protein